MDEDGDQGRDEKTELKTLVLGFLSHGPAGTPSSSQSPDAPNSVPMPSPWDRANEHSFERD